MIRYIALIISIVVVNNIFVYTPQLGFSYYIIMLAAFVLLLLFDMGYKLNLVMFGFILACVLSILVNDIPEFFEPWMRLGTFVIVCALLSPLIESFAFCRFRVLCFWYIQWGILLIMILSGLGVLLGFSYYQGPYFAGVSTHSMLLAPIAANAFMFLLYLYFDNRVTSTKWRTVLFGLMGVSFLLLLMAASRAAFIGLLAAVFFFIYFVGRQYFGRILKWSFTVIIIMAISFPVWNQALDGGLRQKNLGSMGELNVDSRYEHWLQRVDEFTNNPIFGIGFSSVDTRSITGSNYSDDGKVETGSSWLSVLSMLGGFGFFIFSCLYYSAYKNAKFFSEQHFILSKYLLSLMIFWSVHMVAEGYILAAGSFLFFNVWLLFGVIQSLRTFPNLGCHFKAEDANK